MEVGDSTRGLAGGISYLPLHGYLGSHERLPILSTCVLWTSRGFVILWVYCGVTAGVRGTGAVIPRHPVLV